MRRSTEKIELVETHNIALSIRRIRDAPAPGYNNENWKRALYHALLMTSGAGKLTIQRIREALELP